MDITDLTPEQIKQIASLIDDAGKKAARTIWSRMISIIVFSIILIASYNWLLSSLLEDVENASSKSLQQSKVINKEILLKSALDSINTCIYAKDKNLKNEKYYCDTAMMVFKKNEKNISPLRFKSLVEKCAFIGMRDEVKHLIRGVEIDKFNLKKDDSKERLLNKLLTPKWVIIQSVCIVVVLLLFAWSLFWFARRDQQSSA